MWIMVLLQIGSSFNNTNTRLFKERLFPFDRPHTNRIDVAERIFKRLSVTQLSATLLSFIHSTQSAHIVIAS